ncbi:hypothetical protein [Lentilactobacillus senioris]|uniref:hypothetical protein n=1 Tax=Lentilactobacillus senioris TaxID=931534 RepID=UPI003D27D9BE
MSYAIINKRTKKYVYGTDYSRDHVNKDGKHTKNQFTSFGSAIVYADLRGAEREFENRGCGQNYEIQEVKILPVGGNHDSKN